MYLKSSILEQKTRSIILILILNRTAKLIGMAARDDSCWYWILYWDIRLDSVDLKTALLGGCKNSDLTIFVHFYNGLE